MNGVVLSFFQGCKYELSPIRDNRIAGFWLYFFITNSWDIYMSKLHAVLPNIVSSLPRSKMMHLHFSPQKNSFIYPCLI